MENTTNMNKMDGVGESLLERMRRSREIKDATLIQSNVKPIKSILKKSNQSPIKEARKVSMNSSTMVWVVETDYASPSRMDAVGSINVSAVESSQHKQSIPSPLVNDCNVGKKILNTGDTSIDASDSNSCKPRSWASCNYVICLEVSSRFENTLYGYFVGKRLAFRLVENYVKNVWAKFGVKRVQLHGEFFLFQFETKEGMDRVLENGSWLIKMVPLILNVWSPDSDLFNARDQEGSGCGLRKIRCPKLPKVVATDIANDGIEVGSKINTTGLSPNDTADDGFEVVKKKKKRKHNKHQKQVDGVRFFNKLTLQFTLSSVEKVTKDEIKRAVWDCGPDKSPGPDGFMFGFYRRYWKIIESDVVDAVNCFFHQGSFPKGGNSLFIDLIPKTPDVNMVKDFRPISLIGSMYKIIAKILANLLVYVLGDLVNEVQSAFVADKQILDGSFILNKIVQWCKSKKKRSLFFMVDFEKAFDSVRWDYLDDILRMFSFGEKWCAWIQSCLRSSRGSVIVNVSPTEEFQFHKGLKQGDPLSPFLFLLVIESLHISFQRVVDAGMFKGIVLGPSLHLSHMFYVDAAIFVGQWNESNIDTIVHVLECFHRASGLRINMSKSKLMGISVDTDKVVKAATKIGCVTLKTLFTYLGSKVGGLMSRTQSWNETIEVPIKVLQRMKSIRSYFFNGSDPLGKKPIWVKWKDVLASKDKGGLGVSSLYVLNKRVWRFLTQNSSLWARVIKSIHGEDGKIGKKVKASYPSIWLDIFKEVDLLKNRGINLVSYIHKKLGNGTNTSFWEEAWRGDIALKNLFPRAYALESCKSIDVASKM
ncbi:RNA-directed DNA polymerase, eukaryota [Tanacetum coccineum]